MDTSIRASDKYRTTLISRKQQSCKIIKQQSNKAVKLQLRLLYLCFTNNNIVLRVNLE